MASWRELYPFESHWLDLGLSPTLSLEGEGVRMHYLDEGPRDGPVVMMLHGNPTWSFYYRRLIAALSDQYRVVVPDHVGCGLSDKPQKYAYTLAQHIENVERLIADLELTDVSLVVHDWGGLIGMGYATRYPENMNKLVVFNTAAFYHTQPSSSHLASPEGGGGTDLGSALPLRIKMCRIPVLGEVAVQGFNGFARLALRWATAHPQKLTPQIRAGYLAPYNTWKNRIALYQFVQDIPFEAHHRSRGTLQEIEAGLPKLVDHSMLIVWGDQDFCFTTRDFLPGWRVRFPEAEVHVLPEAGHYVVEDAHEVIVPLVRAFLEG